MFGNKTITVIDKTPVFTTESERKSTIKRVENSLYNIFRKYMS